jgi:hypothetical protein
MLRCIFAVYVKMHVQKTPFIWRLLKKLVHQVMKRRFYLWKDRLVMPLDIAMQNAQLKNA